VPSDFTAKITNPYYALTPGTLFSYEIRKDDGIERIETYVSEETHIVMGVETRVVWDREWDNGLLIEDTLDYFAQDKDGNVWYFGEDSKAVAAGKVTSTHGSWAAGVDGAKPGIIMKAKPAVGDVHYQEYYKGEAEDKGEVVSIGETVTVPFGTFADCLKTRDFTPLEPEVNEFKYYCPDVGFVTLEEEEGERLELLEVSTTQLKIMQPTETLVITLSEDEAKRIALERVPGVVTDVEIEDKMGHAAYVVEVRPTGSVVETDVIIDVEDGTVLGVET